MSKSSFIGWYEHLTSDNIADVGGKNASLGEMTQHLQAGGIRVPKGFATTSTAYWDFIEKNNLKDEISHQIDLYQKGKSSLSETGDKIRKMIMKADLPQNLQEDILEAYHKLSKIYKTKHADVAVRSSATAEDLPTASFAGQLESFLNISGNDDLLEAVRKCYASLFTDRAITYREEKGFDHLKIALSVGVQKMIRSDKASSGVIFTIDTETGFPDVIVINGAWGLGENVVQGTVNPDEFRVFKPLLTNKKVVPIMEKSLGSKEMKMIYEKGGKRKTKNIKTTDKERQTYIITDDEVLQLARWAAAIEKHY
ncbi:MAG TPA: PEP/pyruvate-binding domain-containing protein, partial [Balneolales bacterium]|nr:PEP/pyruvate-binding domain-containing protein [Balneolales bacterium]